MSLKLSTNIISDTKIHILKYNLIQKNQNITGDGVVLYIRGSIPSSERAHLISDCLENQSFVISA